MNRISRAFSALLLAVPTMHAIAGTVNGTWTREGRDGEGASLRTVQVGDRVQFTLIVLRGGPSYGLGGISGDFALKNGEGLFASTEYRDCHIRFRFTGKTVRIVQEWENGQTEPTCGFGHNVTATGDLRLRDRRTPDLSVRDPMDPVEN